MNEEDGMATVIIGVISGTIQRDVSLAISLSHGSANGELNSIMLIPNSFNGRILYVRYLNSHILSS